MLFAEKFVARTLFILNVVAMARGDDEQRIKYDRLHNFPRSEVGSWESRIKTRSTKSYNDCQTFPVSASIGFSTNGNGLDLKVYFYQGSGEWKVNITWTPPPQAKQRRCIGYEIDWFKTDQLFEIQWYCDFIPNENITSYTLDSSKHWVQYPQVKVAVFPLPRNSRGFTGRSLRIFHYSPTKENVKQTSTSRLLTDFSRTISTVSTVKPSRRTTINTKTDKPSSDEQATSTSNPGSGDRYFGHVLFPVIAAMVITISLLLCWGWRWKRSEKRNYDVSSEYLNKSNNNFLEGFHIGFDNKVKNERSHYISYYCDNGNAATKIASWLTHHNCHVILDKFDVVTHGKRAWSEHHICTAKKIILIVCSSYLKISKFDASGGDQTMLESYKDQLTYNEICHIRHELIENDTNKERFIIILVETSFNELPFWMKTLHVFKYKKGLIDESILKYL